MKHNEMHIIENVRDVELANIAGLLDYTLSVSDTTCELCRELLVFGKNADLGFIILTETTSRLSCESCLTDVIKADMV